MKSEKLGVQAPQPVQIRPAHLASSSSLRSMLFTEKEVEVLLVLCLDADAERMVSLRYGLEGERRHTFVEIGRLFHLSPESVRRIVKDSLSKIATIPSHHPAD